jgi:hypothetical protein
LFQKPILPRLDSIVENVDLSLRQFLVTKPSVIETAFWVQKKRLFAAPNSKARTGRFCNSAEARGWWLFVSSRVLLLYRLQPI